VESAEPARDEEVLSFDIRRYFDALKKYAWAIAALFALGIAGAVVFTARQPKIYEAKASLQIEPRLPDLLGQGQDIMLGAPAAGADYYKQQSKVIGSYTLIKATVEAHELYLKLLSEHERTDRKLDEQIELATRRLLDELQVKYPDQDRIMYVTVRNEDPQLATDIANQHVATFVDYAKGLLLVGASNAESILAKDFDDAEAKLREADAAMYAFQKENNLLAVSLEDRQSLVSANIASFTGRQNEARAKKIELGKRLELMKKYQDKDVLESPILMMGDSTAFDTLRAEYYTEHAKFLEVQKQVGPKNPEYMIQQAKVEDLLKALQSEANRVIAGVEQNYAIATANEAALGQEVERYKREAFDLGPKIVEYNQLLRKKKTIEDKYTILRNRLSASEMTGSVNNQIKPSHVKPLDPALLPTKPVSPDLRVNLMVGGALALMFGIALISLIVFLDRSIKSTADAQQAAGAAVLGIIPMLEPNEGEDDKERDLYVHRHPTSHVAECCRSLRTNILFSAAAHELKTVIVSSAKPSEGKTTTVLYLGTTMAQSGQRVLLIDTDMRRPRLHGSTSVAREPGLSNLILGDMPYEQVIKETEIPRLFVLPCGPLPPNPAEILMTKRFAEILAELRTRFDRIILDSPPLQAVTDAVVLAKQADGVILVVRAGHTQRDEVKRSARMIRDVGGTIAGMILNELDAKDRGGYYYNYYGYGETKPATKAANESSS